MVGDFVLGDKENVLIQFWEASSVKKTEDGKKYWELKTQDKPFHIVYGYNEALLRSHRMQSVHRTITIKYDDDDDDDDDYDDTQQILIRRVFRNKMLHVIICMNRSCLYIPVHETTADYYSGSPCGVMEYVSNCEEYLEKFRQYLGILYEEKKKKKVIYGNHLYGFGRLNILEHAVLEIDLLLTVVCQKFRLPLAQYWVTTHPHTKPLRVMYQQSHTEMKNLNFLDKFKQACMEMRLNRDEGLVGTAYGSRKTFFCNNIKELSITNQHLAQYASYNMPIPCFIICLKSIFTVSRDCVLEFFLPPQEMITYNHQNLLNSLLATMKDHLPSFKMASGERLGQVLMVEIIDFATHNQPKFFKLGEWKNSLPHHEYEGLPSLEASHLSKTSFGQDEHIVVNTSSTTNSCNEPATGETLERDHARDSVAEIIDLDKLEEESSIKCSEPQSLTSKSKKFVENLNNVANPEELDHSALETNLEVAIKHKEHSVAADTDELVEEPPIVDIGHTMSNEENTMNTASQISNFEPTISLAQQVEKETMVLDTLAQNRKNILVTENDDTTIPVVNKTCQEVHTSKGEIKPQKDISFESLREHFGRPLDDAAASFGVSRSTFKRICRDHGIKRWPNSKRTMSDNISLNLKRKLNDEEPSRRNFSRSGMPSSQDTVVAHTSQHLNKMTVKATYNRVTIRFELSDLSGLAELEDNVIKRLHLEKKSFSIHYQDDEDVWILISCDEDVQQCMEISRSSKKTTIKMKIDEPINNHHAP